MKQQYRITESTLKNIIAEAVKAALLKEGGDEYMAEVCKSALEYLSKAQEILMEGVNGFAMGDPNFEEILSSLGDVMESLQEFVDGGNIEYPMGDEDALMEKAGESVFTQPVSGQLNHRKAAKPNEKITNNGNENPHEDKDIKRGFDTKKSGK